MNIPVTLNSDTLPISASVNDILIKYTSALAEIQRLLAEVEKLKRAYEYDHKCLYEVRDRCELWKQRAEKAEAECLEQARLLGKGAEREADLRGKVERLERALLTNGSERSEIKFFEKL